MTTTDPNILQVNRFIRATPERVFAAWTTPEALKQWFGPESCRVQSAEVDLRVGGAYRIVVLHAEHGLVSVRGVYREITPPSKLVYTWQWEDDPEWVSVESVVTVELSGAEGGTEVRISHEGFPTAESRGHHEFGWNGCLVKLAARASAMNEMSGPGRFCWNELLVTNVEQAAGFYTKLFGWETAPMPGMPYTLFKQNGADVGGMMSKPMLEAPSQWLAYVAVESIQDSVKRAVELGGQVLAPPHQIPDVGWIAIILDPEGVSLGLFQRR